MIRYVLIGFIVFIAILTVFVGYLKLSEPIPVPKIVQQQLQVSPEQSIPSIIKELNDHNNAIKTLASKKVSIKLWEKGLKFSLSGMLYYEKPSNFRLIFNSKFGTELDLGSNDKVFWYWSKHDKYPGVYYASYEDYKKTRLKTPFNPMFIRQSLGMDELSVDNVKKIMESETDLVIVYEKTNSIGDPIMVSVFVDKQSKRITGIIIADVNNEILASAEIQSYNAAGLPTQILYMWYEENKAVLFQFEGIESNIPIDSKNWSMPTYDSQINMADQLIY